VGIDTIHDGDFLTRNGEEKPFSGDKEAKNAPQGAAVPGLLDMKPRGVN
jgi:hypothetical protein